MNFTRLLRTEETADWVREAIARMHPYPYLADAIVILLAFAIGAFVATLVYFLLRHLLLHLYRRWCELSPELLRCIRNMSFCLVSCVPFYTIAYCA